MQFNKSLIVFMILFREIKNKTAQECFITLTVNKGNDSVMGFIKKVQHWCIKLYENPYSLL